MDFVDFNLAKKLKEKGFTCQYPIAMYNELGDFHALYTSADHNPNIKSVFGNREYYDYDDFDDEDCVCPTISQVLKWLREEHNLYVSPQFFTFGAKEIYNLWDFSIIDLKNNALLFPKNELYSYDYYKNYEQAALAGIEYVLDNLI